MNYTIATLGSHSALQILKGAKDEGFKTLLVATEKNADFYRQFSFIETIVSVESFAEFSRIEATLEKHNCILIPHGSFVAYLGKERNKKIHVPYFGNKKVLDWEEDRNLQKTWLTAASIDTPREFTPANPIFPVIIKSFGAAGGSGYIFASNNKELKKGIKSMGSKKYVIQEYVVGVACYPHYFYSPITDTLELMSIDKRYETNVDALGRFPFRVSPSYVVVGNSPLVIRESLLPEVYAMGNRIVQASKKRIHKRGIVGPFCLETIITPDQKFYAIEISARIVAGTNLFTDGSPYSALLYDEPMSTGRRIAREIKIAIKQKKLSLLLD